MRFATILILALILSSPAYGQKTCQSSKYKLLYDGVTFGMNVDKAQKLLESRLKSNALVIRNDHVIIANLYKPMNNIKRMLFFSMNGSVTRILFEYSDSFQSSFGGSAELFIALYNKLKGSYGDKRNQEFNEKEDKAIFFWPNHNGATLQLMGDTSVKIRIDCDELEDEIKSRQTKNANFGF